MPYVLGSEEEEERLNKVITPWNVYETLKYLCAGPAGPHLNRDKIKSNLSVSGIQGCHDNALCKSFETSPHLICLYVGTNIPLGPA